MGILVGISIAIQWRKVIPSSVRYAPMRTFHLGRL